MAEWHGYVGFENLALDVGRRNALHQALVALGPGSDSQPARILHWRTRLDNDAGIYEALFNTANVNLAGWKARLATLFGVDPATVDHEVQVVSFADGQTQVWTLGRNGADYLRVALFGDAWANWEESRREVLGYLALHREEWEEEEEAAPSVEVVAERGWWGRGMETAATAASAVRDAGGRGVARVRGAVGGVLVRFGEWIQGTKDEARQ